MPDPSVLDELVIKIGLDPSGFRQGQQQVGDALKKTRDEALNRTRDIEEAGKRAAEWFTRLRNEVVGLFGVLLGAAGLKDFIQQTAKAEQIMGNLTRLTGLTTKELFLLEEATKRYGGSGDALAQSLGGIAQQIAKITQPGGNAEFAKRLGFLFGPEGLNRIIQQGHLSLADLKELAEKLSKMPVPAAASLAAGIGLDPGSIQLLTRGLAEFNRVLEEVKGHGLMTEEDAKLGSEFAQAMANAQQSMTTLGFALFREVEPDLESGLKHLTGWTDALRENKAAVNQIAHAIEAMFAIKAAPWLLRLLGIPLPAGNVIAAGVGASIAAGKAAEEAARTGSFVVGPEGQQTPVPGTAPPQPPAIPGWRPGAGYLLEHLFGWMFKPGSSGHPELGPDPLGGPGLGGGESWWTNRPYRGGEIQPRRPVRPVPGASWLSTPGGEMPASTQAPWPRARGITDDVSLRREGLIGSDWRRQAGLWGTTGQQPRGTRADPLFTRDINEDQAVFPFGTPGTPGGPATGPGASGATGGVSPWGRNVTGPWRAITSAGQRANAEWLIQQAQRDLGVSRDQALGIVGNAMQESGLNPTIANRSSGAYGFFQFWGSRLTGGGGEPGLIPWAKGQGLDPASREAQWGYALWELKNTPLGQETARRLSAAKTREEAVRAWLLFEAGSDARMQRILRGTPGTDAFGHRYEYAEQFKTPISPDPALHNALRPGAGTTTHHHGPVDNSRSVETHVNGPITIHTAATDAAGIAGGLHSALRRRSFVDQADYGLA